MLQVAVSEEYTYDQSGKPSISPSPMRPTYIHFFCNLLLPSKITTRLCVLYLTTNTPFLSIFLPAFVYLVFDAYVLEPNILSCILLFKYTGSRNIT